MIEQTKKHHQLNKNRKRNYFIILSFPVLLLLVAFLIDTPSGIYNGLIQIILSSDILLVDYIKVGGLGATLANVSILSIMTITLAYLLRVKLNGMLIAATFMTIGFSFFGKNFINVLPMYLGGYLYAKTQKIEFKNILVIIMFSSALAPAVSEIAFGLPLSLYLSIPAAIFFGAFCGFIITPLSANMISIHDGYNLYNVGFSVGIIAIVLNSLFKSFGINLVPRLILSTEYDLFFEFFFMILFTFFLILGFHLNGNSFRGYHRIFQYSGKLITDFTQLEGYGITFINMGVMGFISMLFVLLVGNNGVYNGPVVGAIFAVSGFAAFGKHPKNSIPILIGVYIAGVFKIWDTNSTTFIIAGLFGTALAPISGRFGPIVGILAGFLHISVSMNVGAVHGGLNLYSNGFSCGLIASLLYPLLSTLLPPKKS